MHTSAQEALAAELHKPALLPLNDLLPLVKEFTVRLEATGGGA